MPERTIPHIEAIEVQAFLDLFRLAPQAMIDDDHLAFASFGKGCVVSLPFAPAIGLNRALGMTGTANLQAAFQWFSGRGGKRHFQISEQTATRDELRWISNRHLQKMDGSWTKLSRAAPPTPVNWNGPVEVRQAGRHEAELFGMLMCQGFVFPRKLAPFWSAIVGKRGWSCHIAYLDNTPVGSAIMYVADCYAWLGGGTTIPEFRNRGVQTALIRDRLNVGAEQGVMEFVVETATPELGAIRTSYDNLIKTGFKPSYTRQNYLVAD